jgi:hypothetical protein
MTGGDDDDGSAASSEPEIEYGSDASDASDDDDDAFEVRIEEETEPARDGEVGTRASHAFNDPGSSTSAVDEDVIDVDFAFDDPTPQISSATAPSTPSTP